MRDASFLYSSSSRQTYNNSSLRAGALVCVCANNVYTHTAQSITFMHRL